MRTLGELLFDAGDAAGADHWYRRVLDELADPLARADVALRLANIVYETGSRPESTALARRAVDDAAGDPLLRARALLTWRVADHTSATRHLTRAARELLEEDPDADPITMAWALFQEAADAFDAGNGPLDVEAIDRALVLERQGRRWRSDDQVANTRAALLKFADRLDDARAALDELLQRAEEEGNFGQLPYLVGHLVGVYLRLGDYDAAATAADRHLELAEATGQPAQVAQAHYNLGLVALHQGDLEGAVEGARRLGEFLDLVDDVYLRRNLAGLLGGVAFVRGDITAAVTELERWWAVGQEIDDNPGISRLHGEFLDVLVLSGDVERATALLPKMEERASRAGAHSVLAALARSSATISAARGDLSAAFTSIDAALAEHDLASIPVERGRTLLLKGQLHRRAKEKSAARDALSEALALFERAGALAWAKRARDELRRVNIRPAAPLELTATERRIAELAIQGLTNKEIAAAAFLSPKTVEANLARIYRKLGIRSRVELAARGGDT